MAAMDGLGAARALLYQRSSGGVNVPIPSLAHECPEDIAMVGRRVGQNAAGAGCALPWRMRTPAIVAVALLAVVPARPAIAQTSGWDFTSKPPAAKDTAETGHTPALKKSEASTQPAAGKIAASTPHTSSAVADSSASHPSSGTRPHAARPTSPEPAARHSTAPAVNLIWGDSMTPSATSGVSHAGVVLQWEGADTDPVATATTVTIEKRDTRVPPSPASPTRERRTVDAPPAAPEAPVAPVAQVAPVAPKVAGPSEPRKPQPTGLERLSDEWPNAIKVGLQYRGRVESPRGLSVTRGGTDDTYYLNRVRLDASIVVAPWLRVVGQVQDAMVLKYDVGAAPTTMANAWDLRLGYVALERGVRGPFVRVGRQDLGYGGQRLIASPDWGNTNRTFDAVRAGWADPRFRVEWFGAVPVTIVQGGFDVRSPTERISGAVVTLPRVIPKGTLESYALLKTVTAVTSELGVRGRASTYTIGSRAAGVLSGGFDYALEAAVQRGDRAGDAISAWAGSYVFGWNVRASGMRPRLTLEFDHASGDANAKDGRIGTFDQLYPSNHAKYGLADQIGWKNMRVLRTGLDVTPTPKFKLKADVSRLWLATIGDAFYASNGSIRMLNRQATSRAIGTELDLQGTYAFSKELSFGAGVATLFADHYLAQSTGGGTLWTPYLMWNVKF